MQSHGCDCGNCDCSGCCNGNDAGRDTNACDVCGNVCCCCGDYKSASTAYVFGGFVHLAHGDLKRAERDAALALLAGAAGSSSDRSRRQTYGRKLSSQSRHRTAAQSAPPHQSMSLSNGHNISRHDHRKGVNADSRLATYGNRPTNSSHSRAFATGYNDHQARKASSRNPHGKLATQASYPSINNQPSALCAYGITNGMTVHVGAPPVSLATTQPQPGIQNSSSTKKTPGN